METTTIKLNPGEYFTSEHLPDKDIFFIVGARGIGKSYTVKHLVADCLKRGEQFMYVRMASKELSTCISWLNEVDLTTIFGFEGSIQRGEPYAGALRYNPIYDDDKKNYEPEIIGHVVSLETSALIKSAVFTNTTLIVFEEYSRHNLSWKQEVECSVNFLELLETVARFRQVKVYCISNHFKGISPLENIFSTAINACKVRIFSKRKEKQGILQGVQDKYKRYLEGEILENPYVKLTDYEPIVCIKHKNTYVTLYSHLHDKIGNYAFALNKTKVDIAINLGHRLWGLERKIIHFKDYKSELFVRSDFEEVLAKIQIEFRKTHQETLRNMMFEKDRKVVKR